MLLKLILFFVVFNVNTRKFKITYLVLIILDRIDLERIQESLYHLSTEVNHRIP